MRRFTGILTATLLISIILGSGGAVAGDWGHWRGPDHNGGTEARDLPATWSTDEGVLWATDLPGSSSATPVIVGDRVFVVSNNARKTQISAICLNRDTGKELWSKVLVDNADSNARNDMGACSPVTDGEGVFFLFGNSELYGLDMDGNELWSRNLNSEISTITQDWGYSGSPLLHNGKLYVSVIRGTNPDGSGDWGGRNDSGCFLLCVDPATGKDIWRAHRPSEAVGEALDSYASPIPFSSNGVDSIVVIGADIITANDAATGKELWRQEHNPRRRDNWRMVPSLVANDSLVFGTQPRGGTFFAVDPNAKKNMEYGDTAWKLEGAHNDVPTPLLYDGRLYVLVDTGMEQGLSCVDPATGKELWRGDLAAKGRFWSSPTAGDGKIYCVNEDGDVVTVAAGDTFKLLGTSRMGGKPTMSTVAIADNKLFIRTAEKLYCVGS
jgi:outer membrane protein assembly factor BamB